MADWSPATYMKFEGERTRAARDLLVGVPLGDARKVVDVGCGPGNSTELLVARYPQADVVGFDNSPAMLSEAAKRLPGVRFEAADAATWRPTPDVDLVYANATYQWIPNHFEVLPQVLSALGTGAVLAVQMPDNIAEPTHRLMRETAAALGWAERLAAAGHQPLPPPRAYYDALSPYAVRVDIWRTAYQHVLAGAAAIVEFIRSTGLRPYLDPLSELEREAFVADFTARIAAAYPPLADGRVLLQFPRLFLVALR